MKVLKFCQLSNLIGPVWKEPQWIKTEHRRNYKQLVNDINRGCGVFTKNSLSEFYLFHNEQLWSFSIVCSHAVWWHLSWVTKSGFPAAEHFSFTEIYFTSLFLPRMTKYRNIFLWNEIALICVEMNNCPHDCFISRRCSLNLIYSKTEPTTSCSQQLLYSNASSWSYTSSVSRAVWRSSCSAQNTQLCSSFSC